MVHGIFLSIFKIITNFQIYMYSTYITHRHCYIATTISSEVPVRAIFPTRAWSKSQVRQLYVQVDKKFLNDGNPHSVGVTSIADGLNCNAKKNA